MIIKEEYFSSQRSVYHFKKVTENKKATVIEAI